MHVNVQIKPRSAASVLKVVKNPRNILFKELLLEFKCFQILALEFGLTRLVYFIIGDDRTSIIGCVTTNFQLCTITKWDSLLKGIKKIGKNVRK